MKLQVLVLAAIYCLAHSQKDVNPISEIQALEYLEKFGYLDDYSESELENLEFTDDGREEVRQAVMQFQRYVGLETTGRLDNKTKEMMTRPRCGMPDESKFESLTRVVVVPSFMLPPPKYTHTLITYRVNANTKKLKAAEVREAMKDAFAAWAQYVPLKFQEVLEVNVAVDILVEFYSYSHLNCTGKEAFDGEGGVLAHAKLPYNQTGNYLHFDESEKWAYKTEYGTDVYFEGYRDLFYTAVHEVGHLLGLQHTAVPGQIMNAVEQNAVDSFGNYIAPLIKDYDINRIRNLYNETNEIQVPGKGDKGAGNALPNGNRVPGSDKHSTKKPEVVVPPKKPAVGKDEKTQNGVQTNEISNGGTRGTKPDSRINNGHATPAKRPNNETPSSGEPPSKKPRTEERDRNEIETNEISNGQNRGATRGSGSGNNNRRDTPIEQTGNEIPGSNEPRSRNPNCRDIMTGCASMTHLCRKGALLDMCLWTCGACA